MKRLMFILKFVFFNTIIFSQVIKQVESINIEEFPKVRFKLHISNYGKASKDDLILYEENKKIDFDFTYEKVDLKGKKNLLILVEDLHGKEIQRDFYLKIVEKTIDGILKEGFYVNIAFFDRRTDSELLMFLLKNYTNNADTLKYFIELIKNELYFYNYKNIKTSDLYEALIEGINSISSTFPKENNFILLFSAGLNNPHSQFQKEESFIKLSHEKEVPIYMIQYPNVINKMENSIKETYGEFEMTSDLKIATDRVTYFFKNALDKKGGYIYTFNFESSERPSGSEKKIKLILNNKSIEINYIPKCKNFDCYLKFYGNYVLISILLIAIIVSLIILLSTKFKKKIQKIENSKEELKHEINRLNNEVDNYLQEINNVKSKNIEIQRKIEQEKEKKMLLQIEEEAKQKMKRFGPLPTLIIELNNKIQTYIIDKPEFVVGRINCDCNIPSNYVSRQHFKIMFKNDGYYIQNLSKTNPTIVNGKVISNILKLNNNDKILAGPVLIIFSF